MLCATQNSLVKIQVKQTFPQVILINIGENSVIFFKDEVRFFFPFKIIDICHLTKVSHPAHLLANYHYKRNALLRTNS